MQRAQERPRDIPDDECDDALDEDPDEEDRTIEEKGKRAAVTEPLDVLLGNEADYCNCGKRPQGEASPSSDE